MSDIPDDKQRHINRGDDFTHFTGDGCPPMTNSKDPSLEEIFYHLARKIQQNKPLELNKTIAAIEKHYASKVTGSLDEIFEYYGISDFLDEEQASEAKTKIEAHYQAKIVEAEQLLKLWVETFDDDGNLDGYTTEAVRELQKQTYRLLSIKRGVENG